MKNLFVDEMFLDKKANKQDYVLHLIRDNKYYKLTYYNSISVNSAENYIITVWQLKPWYKRIYIYLNKLLDK